MMDSSKRKNPPGGSSDARGGKRSKGGSGGKWQTPHQKAKAERPRGGGKIEPGDVGIWATCAKGKEGLATEELKGMFGVFAEQMYGVTVDATGKVTAEDGDGDDDDEDIEAAIKKEVAEMGNKEVGDLKLITPVFLDLACVLFFKTTAPIEPLDFVQKICEDAVRNPAGRKTRFTNRLTPMKAMGKATEKGLEEVGREVLGQYFELETGSKDEDKTEIDADTGENAYSYAIRPTIRNHSTLKRDVVIKLVASLVASRHKVDLTKPDKVIIVEIYQTICGMSVVNGNEWESLKRFNLAELYQPTPKPSVPQASKVVTAALADGEATTTPKADNTDEKDSHGSEGRQAETPRAS